MPTNNFRQDLQDPLDFFEKHMGRTLIINLPFIFSISNFGFNLFFQKALHFFLLGHCQKVF